MSEPFRLALAISGSEREPSPAGLGVMAGLASRQCRVQHFASRARPVGNDAARMATGLPGRHLDSWLMDTSICLEVFRRGCRAADFAVVEGTFDAEDYLAEPNFRDRPGRLGPLAQVLDLPVLAVIPYDRPEAFHLPPLPPGVSGLILDGLPDPGDYPAVKKVVELLARLPVVGAIETLPEVRQTLREEPTNARANATAIARLRQSFLRFADLGAIHRIARSRAWPRCSDNAPRLDRGGRYRVAYARDEAFGGYFPDTLEALEALGAELIEFSPLRDEALPDDVDLVMIGCGVPDLHAQELSANHSLIGDLRNHVCRHKRMYSEGGGTAYLGRTMRLPGGCVRGAGIFPFDAELRSQPVDPFPVTRTLIRPSWIGRESGTVRGYRSGRWRFHLAPEVDDGPARSGLLTDQSDMIFRNQAVGSLVHLHLASLPEVVAAFAQQESRLLVPRS